MKAPDFESKVGPLLAGALVKRGFTALMPVQEAMLDPELEGRDLRVSSQTGSGKTVAIGLAIRALAEGPAPADKGVARPRALVVVPTRELAKQVDAELTWLYAPLGTRVASATGGANIRDERRAFAGGPQVIVGTPGRLLDHLKRGSINPRELAAVVLDEADRMLDLGFREDLEAIMAHAPPGHRTHLVSATFPREVLALANKVQDDPAHVEGSPLGTANADIDHLVHLVAPHDRLGAIMNLLLATPGGTSLVFARTRADVARFASDLAEAGFNVRALSGEMEQGERDRALAAFKRGNLHALVATDVAARGIDVNDIARVIHAEPPTDADSYTHRSGRTGRAGRKGLSSVLVSPSGLARVSQLLRRAGVRFRMEPIPTAASLRRAGDERVIAELVADDDGVEPTAEKAEQDARLTGLAERLAETGNVVRTLARLLARAQIAAGPEPREVRAIELPSGPARAYPSRGDTAGHAPATRGHRDAPAARGHRDAPAPRGHHDAPSPRARHDAPPARAHHEAPPERGHRGAAASRVHHDAPATRDHHEAPPARAHRDEDATPRARSRDTEGGWVPFRVSWGQEGGADPRRLLAMACRRGGIRSADVGVIHVARNYSVVNVASTVAESFARAAEAHDPRDPRITIRRDRTAASGSTEPTSADARPRANDGGYGEVRRSSHATPRPKRER